MKHHIQSAVLAAGMSLAMQGALAAPGDVPDPATDLRIDVGARLSGPRHSPWRAFGSADFELSPARLAKQHFANPSFPALPSFSIGLALGVSWSGK